MNAIATKADFRLLAGPRAEWLVLRCSSSRTLALAAALAEFGAWTPTWKRKRRLPRSPLSRVITEACIPSFVFIPASQAFDLPPVPRIGYSFMRLEGALVRIADRELEPLRSIADKPLLPARKLPKPGERMRFAEGPFQGLDAKVIACNQRYCSVTVPGFSQPIQVPPFLLRGN